MYVLPKPNPPVPPLSGMGQAVPPIPRATTETVIYGAIGLVAFSFGAYLIMRKRKRGQEQKSVVLPV